MRNLFFARSYSQALRGKLLSTHVWIATLGGIAKEFILTLWKGTFPMVAQ